MITREKKEALIQSVSESAKKSKAFFLVDFKGLSVENVTSLRKKLFNLGAELKVSRNTLAKIALKKAGISDQALDAQFIGNNAFVFAYQDPAAVAKAVSEFAKDQEALKLKSGFMDGQVLDQKQVVYLASLPSKETLQAQLLGVLLAPGSKLARTLNEVPASLARVLKARSEQQQN
ncbi:MAG: 50S ribosomal protein L10 [Bdellovibrionaceae bacterium]|jgi:large subunit ribosomal protein L10|nr:50S ribosomal protein L10 [Pseudobdellovibrionaceae bacterium]